MPNTGTKTASMNTHWVVEFYDFTNPVPEAADASFFSALPNPAAIIGSFFGSNLKQYIDEIYKNNKADSSSAGKEGDFSQGALSSEENSYFENYGLQSINFSRSKQNPASTCNLSVIGPLPKYLYLGVWAIVSQISTSTTAIGTTKIKRVIKFIGQIADVQTNYSMSSSGLLSTSSTINLTEWSSVLTTPIKFDARSIRHMLKEQSAGNLIQKFSSAVESFTGSPGLTFKMADFLGKSLDPFQFAHQILNLVGVISKYDALPGVQDVDDIAPNFALTPQEIPAAVLQRIGSTKSNPVSGTSSPFSSGFIKVITGLQLNPVYNKGDWNGVFGEVTESVDHFTLDNLSDIMQTSYEAIQNRPKILGASILSQTQFSAWELLSQYCDNDFNEVYTDFFYEKKPTLFGSGFTLDDVSATPVIMMRAKPFLLKSLLRQRLEPPVSLKTKAEMYASWPKYDDVPRINIPSEYIVQASFVSSADQSPNYIIPNLFVGGLKQEIAQARGQAFGILRLKAEQSRFGGNMTNGSPTTFYADFSNDKLDRPNNPAFTNYFDLWIDTMSQLTRLWHSYSYRMPTMNLAIKDDGLSLSLGMNVQFKMGNFTLCGHINNMSSSCKVDQTGRTINTTILGITRVCAVDELLGGLSFLPMDAVGRLFVDFPRQDSLIADAATGFLSDFDPSSLV